MSEFTDYGNTQITQHGLKDQITVRGFKQHCKLVHGCMVCTEHVPGWSQIRLAPAIPQKTKAVTTLLWRKFKHAN